MKVLDPHGAFVRHITGEGLEQYSSTGLALSPTSGNLVLINWRTKHVTEISVDGVVVKKFTSDEFREPTSIAVNRHGEIIVADTGLCKLLVFDCSGKLINKIGSKGDKPGQFRVISAVHSCGQTDEILVTDNRLQVFSRAGKFLHEIGGVNAAHDVSLTPGKSHSSRSHTRASYSGVARDADGNILATRTEKGKSPVVQVYTQDKRLKFEIDSFSDKLKRPSGVCIMRDGRVVVADLGNDCIKVYRYC